MEPKQPRKRLRYETRRIDGLLWLFVEGYKVGIMAETNEQLDAFLAGADTPLIVREKKD